MGMKAATNPFGKRTMTAASVAAARPAMPTYRPNIIQSGGSGAMGAQSEYSRAPPRMNAAEFEADADGQFPPQAQVSKNGSSKRIEGLAPKDIEAGDCNAMEMDMDDVEMVQPATVQAGLEVEEDDGTGQPGVVPFMSEQQASTGLDWFQICEEEAAEAQPPSQPTETPAAAGLSSAAGMPPLDEDGTLHMFWLDAYEDAVNAPGSVFLFGKVRNDSGNGYSSCCVTLKGMERNVFALPRERALVNGEEAGEEVSFVQLFREVQQLCRKHKIGRFGCKRVDRSYAFEESDMPQSSSYLKLVYSAEFGTLPPDTSGTYFRKLIGTNTSCLEQLLLKRKIMGPCWLSLQGAAPSTASVSWCKYEVTLPQGKKALNPLANPPPSPPLIAASIHVQTVLNSKHVPEIVMASVITHSNVAADGATEKPTSLTAFSAVRKIDGRSWPWDLQRTVNADKRLKLEICPSERALLNFFIARLHNIDADVLVGHNVVGYDMTVLLQRLSACKIQHWSKVLLS